LPDNQGMFFRALKRCTKQEKYSKLYEAISSLPELKPRIISNIKNCLTKKVLVF
jgi:hypothetical protein